MAEIGAVEVNAAEVGAAEVRPNERVHGEVGVAELWDLLTCVAPSIPLGDAINSTNEQLESFIAVHVANLRHSVA